MILYHMMDKDLCKELVATYSDQVKPWRPSPRKTISTAEITLPWYKDVLDEVIERSNKQYGFDVTGLTDTPAIVRYDEGSFFGWHHDQYSGRDGVHRKFSIITILSDPDSYEGGTLEFFDHGLSPILRPKQGLVVVFPSWMQHRVTKVTKGTRYSAVAFVGGPQFR